MIYDHAPQPGPLYWDFRCMACGEDVSKHAGFVRRLWRDLKVRRTERRNAA